MERCKAQVDYLIVGICNDDYVRKIKKKEPVYNEIERLRIIQALKVVDKAELVTIEETDDKMIAFQKYKPELFTEQ